jgi:N-acetyl-alpha-D-glucosaminyl L-malate synthase BshA
LHGTDITLVGKDKTYSPVVTFSMNESDAITAVSKNLRDETFRNFKMEKEIQVIYNFVDVKRFNRKPIDAFKKVIAPANEKILLHASNFRKVKRVEDVVKVFVKVNAEIPSKLLFVGDGPERPYIETLCRESEVCNDIRFLGKQEQMEDILAISDVFLLPSEYESFGLAALEAMAAAVPVISTNAGGLPEINVNGISGFLSNVGDIDDMCKNALHILTDEKMLKKFKDGALAHANKFDINNIVPEYEALYNTFI